MLHVYYKTHVYLKNENIFFKKYFSYLNFFFTLDFYQQNKLLLILQINR